MNIERESERDIKKKHNSREIPTQRNKEKTNKKK